jgi:hypothetical protein
VVTSRREGQAFVINTPTGQFTATLLKFVKAENFAMLDLQADWTGSEGQVLLRREESVSPRVLAGLVKITLEGWTSNRATFRIEGPEDWKVFRGEALAGLEAS